MTFISTYSGGSIRGWQSTTGFPIFIETEKLEPNLTLYPRTKEFGYDLDLSYDGNYLIVGTNETFNPSIPGNAFIYLKNVGTNDFDFQQSLTPNNYSSIHNWQFGAAVAIDAVGATAVIGATQYDSNIGLAAVGTAYIFNRTGTSWTQEQQLLSADANSFYFGQSVAINYYGNLVAIGSEDNQTAARSGAVFIFAKTGNTWTNIQKLKGSSSGVNADFGSTLALSNDQNANYLVVGAIGEVGQDGAIYIYNRSGNTYVEQQRIQQPGPGTGSDFGVALAINDDGNIIAVGCPDNSLSTPPGKVFIYTRSGNTWSLFQTITSSTTSNGDSFGGTVALNSSGNTLFVSDIGYPATANTSPQQGSIFAFQQISSYVETQLITANTANLDRLGQGLTCDSIGSTFAAGAPGANLSNTVTDTGVVYIFNS
jgi:hypothetical protein